MLLLLLSSFSHRWQPSRLGCPWDSSGKNTGVGCHFLLQCMKVKSESEVTQSCPTLHNRMDCSLPGSSIHGIFQARVLEWGAITSGGTLQHLLNEFLPTCISPLPSSSLTPFRYLKCGFTCFSIKSTRGKKILFCVSPLQFS